MWLLVEFPGVILLIFFHLSIAPRTAFTKSVKTQRRTPIFIGKHISSNRLYFMTFRCLFARHHRSDHLEFADTLYISKKRINQTGILKRHWWNAIRIYFWLWQINDVRKIWRIIKSLAGAPTLRFRVHFFIMFNIGRLLLAANVIHFKKKKPRASLHLKNSRQDLDKYNC